jgi:hypothetical protein
LEVKCPFCLADAEVTLEDYLVKNKCLQKDEDGDLVWNKNHNYYYQIQLQMLISARTFGYFVIWRKESVLAIRTEVDLQFLSEKTELAKRFFYQVIMPELMAGYFTLRLVKKGK